MPRVTVSIPEPLFKASRQYARSQGTSLPALIRQLLEQRLDQSSSEWLNECFRLMDQAGVDSGGQSWNRDEWYDV